MLELQEVEALLKNCISSLNSLSRQKPPTEDEINIISKEIIERWDGNHDGKLTLKEFRSNISKDEKILECLLQCELITPEDLRPDFGGFSRDPIKKLIPDCDSDIEQETHERDIERDPRKDLIKHGFEYKVSLNAKGKTRIIEEASHQKNQPWYKMAKSTEPSNYELLSKDHDAPEASLELEYIYGYRCHDVRNNIYYNNEGHLVYHTAGVGIVLNKEKNTQKFFMDHTDDITGFCLSPYDNKIVATGQVGCNPMISIWNSNDVTTKLTLSGVLQEGISHLCLSRDGKKLAAVSLDAEHCIAIYDLEKLYNLKKSGNHNQNPTEGIIANIRTTKAFLLDLAFDPTDTYIVMACNKEVNFIDLTSKDISVKKASLGKDPLAILTIGFIGNELITGAYNGALMRWKNESVNETTKAHDLAITAMYSRKDGLITGSNDGMVILWNKNLIVQKKINMNNVGSMCPKIRAVCEDQLGNIAIGTRGGEIYEVLKGQETGKFLIKGHFDEELWGLSTNPTAPEFATIGEDNLLSIWDVRNRKQIKCIRTENSGKICSYSPNGKTLATGFENGNVIIYDSKTLKLMFTIKDRVQEITQIKYSPTGVYLAVGGNDTEIFIYNVKKNYEFYKKLRGFHSTVSHFDFSADSKTLQSNSSSMEINYFDVKTGKTKKDPAPEVRDLEWASWTCIFGWPVKGIWPACSESEDINAVDRHPDGNVIATADDFSKVKLFKYPCPIEGSSYVKYVGHSDHVTNVRFTAQGDYLISTGGFDKSIFQWKYTFDHKSHELLQHLQNEEIKEKQEIIPEEIVYPTFAMVEEISEGDQLLAVKPFLGEMKASTPDYKPPPNQKDAPNANLNLKYCHGYRCFDAQNCAKYNNKNQIVFVGAALGVVMDSATRAQKFFQMHEEDIICLAVDPTGKIAATGQMAQKGKAKLIDLYVWDIETKQVLANLKGFHLRAVSLINFSPDGSKILSGGQDDDNSIAIYEWAQKRLLASSKVDKAKSTAAIWKTDSEFMTCGLKHVKFYTLKGANISGQRAELGEALAKEAFLCGVYQPGSGICFAGTQNGNIVPFNGRSAGKVAQQAHQGAVWTLYATKNNLYSGGQDGKVKIWSWKNGVLQSVGDYCDTTTITKFPAPGIRSLDMKVDEKMMLVGTRSSEIYEVEKGGKNKLLLQGHYDGELWGCATSPTSTKYVTCGGDKTIRIWDTKTYSLTAYTVPLENDVRAVDWSSNGNYIVAGDLKGKIWLYNQDLKFLDSKQSSFNKINQWIEVF